jgi:hypothetical protein
VDLANPTGQFDGHSMRFEAFKSHRLLRVTTHAERCFVQSWKIAAPDEEQLAEQQTWIARRSGFRLLGSNADQLVAHLLLIHTFDVNDSMLRHNAIELARLEEFHEKRRGQVRDASRLFEAACTPVDEGYSENMGQDSRQEKAAARSRTDKDDRPGIAAWLELVLTRTLEMFDGDFCKPSNEVLLAPNQRADGRFEVRQCRDGRNFGLIRDSTTKHLRPNRFAEPDALTTDVDRARTFDQYAHLLVAVAAKRTSRVEVGHRRRSLGENVSRPKRQASSQRFRRVGRPRNGIVTSENLSVDDSVRFRQALRHGRGLEATPQLGRGALRLDDPIS